MQEGGNLKIQHAALVLALCIIWTQAYPCQNVFINEYLHAYIHNKQAIIL